MRHSPPGRGWRGGPALVVLVVALAGGTAGAQTAARAPAAVSVRLDNGLRLVFQPDPASPVVAVCAFVQASAAQETLNASGVRELLQLMGEETLLRPGEAEEEPPPAVELSGAVSRDYVESVALCLPEDFAGALRRLRKTLFEPYFSEEAFRYAQERLGQEIMARGAEPGAVAQDAVVARLYPQWPGSWPLVGAGAATWIGREFAEDFHARHYLSNNTLLSVCGALDWATVRAQVEQSFGNLLPGARTELVTPVLGATPLTEPLELSMAGARISAVAMGARGPDLGEEDYPATSVLMAVLGNGRGSRLYRRLREQENASYVIQAGVTPSRVCPYAYLMASCQGDQVGAVRAAMAEELARLGEAAPGEAEVARARRVLVGQYQLQQQEASQMAHYLGLFALLGKTPDPQRWQALTTRLSAVRPEQVLAAAQKYLSQAITVVVRGE